MKGIMSPQATSQPGTVSSAILDVRGLNVVYDGEVPVPACVEISFTLRKGEILGIAGESGSGKSTLITALTRLQRAPARVTGGRILFTARNGECVDLTSLTEQELRRLRWTEIAIVMQSAMDALNPVMRLGAQFADAIREHDQTLSRKQITARTGELLAMVGISEDRARSYPHELSGGMRQRATIALALACQPQLVVMDEPTTAVDVVMQRQILSQILRLRDELGFAVIFVTHDLSLLLELADRVAIMYAGRVVETGSAEDLYLNPKHPYTKGLRDSFPPLREPLRPLLGIPGSPPDLRRLPEGCAFHPRCTQKLDVCTDSVPELRATGGQQSVACRLYDGDKKTSTRREQQQATQWPHKQGAQD